MANMANTGDFEINIESYTKPTAFNLNYKVNSDKTASRHGGIYNISLNKSVNTVKSCKCNSQILNLYLFQSKNKSVALQEGVFVQQLRYNKINSCVSLRRTLDFNSLMPLCCSVYNITNSAFWEIVEHVKEGRQWQLKN